MNQQNITLKLKNKSVLHECFICLVESFFPEIEPCFLEVLSPKEKTFFEKIPSQIRQHTYLLGRYSAKQALSKIYSVPMHTMFIESGIFNQPVLMTPRDLCFQVSLSHTKNFGGAIAFPETHPMGIDIEEISHENNVAIYSQMTCQELEVLNREDLSTRLTITWTAKEALSKVLRCGLMVSFKLLEICSYQQNQKYIECFFKHFPQYKSISWKYKSFIITIVCPKELPYELIFSA